jgi:hypothetical protein
MTIEEFVTKAEKQDARNCFEPFFGDVSFVPEDIRDFYVLANPVDVEISTRKFGNVRFFPIEQIEDIKNEYSFMPNDTFIFASTNGDPIFIEKTSFYITCESRYLPEFISRNFREFLDVLKMEDR